MQVGVGPQHRETGKPVSTSTASWGGAPTQRNWDYSFHKYSKLERPYEIFLFQLDFCPAPES
ncbi:hypothetical protein [Staphylococcus marylandisciuri]|uniref:hypothetical protein n=1 Tax=Staphylococcus marylandisciuri TaxID=2981529 RepID=UPI0021D336C9|nr:hypothetical protein [Staphylococcus marylandisciuri]